MESEIIHLKSQISKLIRQQIIDKQTNLELVEDKKLLLLKLSEQENAEEILLDPSRAQKLNRYISNTDALKQTGHDNLLLLKTSAHLTKVALLSDLFMGKYNKSRVEETSVSIHPAEWDFVIVLHNSDYTRNFDKYISQPEATKIFSKSFHPEQSKVLQTQRENKHIENRAFAESFNSLPDYLGKGKLLKSGGRLTKSIDGAFLDHGGLASDYMSLIRNIMLVKLTLHLGLQTRQVLSSNGQFIYILIYADDKLLQNEAERIEHKVQLEEGATDLLSLEPCDKLLRPLRLTESHEMSVNELLDSMDGYFTEMFETYNEDNKSKYEMYKMTELHWEVYKRYLLYVKDKLSMMTELSLTREEKKYFYQRILKKAMQRANEGVPSQYQLKSLWKRLGIGKSFGTYSNFIRNYDDEGTDRFYPLWKKRTISEAGRVSVFRNSARYKLIFSLILKQVSLYKLQDYKLVETYFPLASHWEITAEPKFPLKRSPSRRELSTSDPDNIFKTSKKGLTAAWSQKLFDLKLPLMKIRSYFGEKIAMYFNFLSFLGGMVYWPGLFGVGVFIVQLLFPQGSTVTLVCNAVFCVYVAGWATTFMEYWKRKESSYAIKWGQNAFEEAEVPRPQFTGKLRRSPMTDEMDDIHYPEIKRYKWFVLAVFVTLMLLSLVVVSVIGIHYLRWLSTDLLVISRFDIAGGLFSLVNALQIQIFNNFYKKIALKLTTLENHRLQSEYESSLIIKTYIFQFINSYNYLFYIAYLKTHVEGCIVWDGSALVREEGGSCMSELFIQLITLFLVTFSKNIIELLIPILLYRWNKRKFTMNEQQRRMHELGTTKTDFHILRDSIDHQIQLPAYITREKDGTLEDYLELTVLFGYVVLFAVAFPIAGILAYLAILVEIRVDKVRLVHFFRRPQPQGGKSIGIWKAIFNFICIVAVFTNVGVLCFTANTFQNWPLAANNIFITFTLFCTVLFGFRSYIQLLIPDLPRKYQTILKRQRNIIDKYLRGWDAKKITKKEAESYLNPKIYCTYKPTELDIMEIRVK